MTTNGNAVRWVKASNLSPGANTVAYGTVTANNDSWVGRVRLDFNTNHSASFPFDYLLAVWS